MNDEQERRDNALVSTVRQLPARAALVSRGIAMADSLLHSRPSARLAGVIWHGPGREHSTLSAPIPQPAASAAEHLRQARKHLEQAAQWFDDWHRSYSGRPTTASAAIFDKAIRELLAGYAAGYAGAAAGKMVDDDPYVVLDMGDRFVTAFRDEIVPDSVRQILLWLHRAASSTGAERARIEHELWADIYWFEPVENLNWFLEKVVTPAMESESLY